MTSIDILYKMAVERLNTQIKTIDGIDHKIGVTFTLANVITAAAAAFITQIPRPVPQLVIIFIVLSAVAYITTLLFLFLAYKYSRWSFNPKMRILQDICTNPNYNADTDSVKKWVANTCIKSIELNRNPIAIKLRRAYRALISVSAQGLFLAVSYSCYLFN